jgi:hypothetical protein
MFTLWENRMRILQTRELRRILFGCKRREQQENGK